MPQLPHVMWPEGGRLVQEGQAQQAALLEPKLEDQAEWTGGKDIFNSGKPYPQKTWASGSGHFTSLAMSQGQWARTFPAQDAPRSGAAKTCWIETQRAASLLWFFLLQTVLRQLICQVGRASPTEIDARGLCGCTVIVNHNSAGTSGYVCLSQRPVAVAHEYAAGCSRTRAVGS